MNLQKLLQEVILEQFDWISKGSYQTDFQIPEKDIFVQGNEQYIKRILNNLFSNMQKYTVSEIRVVLVEKQGKVILTMENDVEDVNMDCQRVFEPFYRGAARSKPGSGLGLYVVKCLTEKMNMKATAMVEEHRFSVKITN
ncbi:MAG: ATP-binding protein [Lachnospiraceae bacterium]|nr:ATP-binding protein [Lachnospiraceae bacterium]